MQPNMYVLFLIGIKKPLSYANASAAPLSRVLDLHDHVLVVRLPDAPLPGEDAPDHEGVPHPARGLAQGDVQVRLGRAHHRPAALLCDGGAGVGGHVELVLVVYEVGPDGYRVAASNTIRARFLFFLQINKIELITRHLSSGCRKRGGGRGG